MPKKPIHTRVAPLFIRKQFHVLTFLSNLKKLLGDYSLSKSACMAKNEVEQFSKDLHNLSPFIASQSELHDKIKKCKI